MLISAYHMLLEHRMQQTYVKDVCQILSFTIENPTKQDKPALPVNC